MSLLREYGKLARVHSAVLTGLAPVLGAISAGMLDGNILFVLFLIGVSTHIFGFAFNEYMDINIDRRSEILKNKPLVKGTISKFGAITFAFSGVIIGYFLILFLMITWQSIGLFGVTFYTLSWFSIGIYDLTSKSVRGSDLALALWTGSLCLFGGFAVTQSPPKLLYIISALAFFQLLIQNIIAGLKDLSQDRLGNGTTTPLRMGVGLKKNTLLIPNKFQFNIYTLKIIHFFIVFIPFIFLWLRFNFYQLFFILLLLGINFIIVFLIFNSPKYNRNTLLRLIGLHEILSYSIVPILLISIIGFQTLIFLIISPIIWLALFMKFLYGEMLPNI